jgi:ubiquinone/menaquinone biosynthesis C-methylase UbiE
MTRGLIEGKQALDYDKRMRARSKHNDSIRNFILQNIRQRKANVCDLCCGTGIDIEILKGKVGKITGVDLSKDMINICRKKFRGDKKVRLVAASSTDTKLGSEQFDFVIIRMGMHHIKDKKSLVDELYRLLKPNGRLILIDKYCQNILDLYIKSFLKFLKCGKFTALEEYILSKEQNERVLSRRFIILKRKSLEMSREYMCEAFMLVLKKRV